MDDSILIPVNPSEVVVVPVDAGLAPLTLEGIVPFGAVLESEDTV